MGRPAMGVGAAIPRAARRFKAAVCPRRREAPRIEGGRHLLESVSMDDHAHAVEFLRRCRALESGSEEGLAGDRTL